MPKITARKLAENLKDLIRCFEEKKQKIEVEALNAGMVPMMRRIFGTGISGGGTAIDGTSLGKYTPAYQRYRLVKNKGVNLTKNLVFSGGLRNSINVVSQFGKSVVWFDNPDAAKIGRYQEGPGQVNKPIFGFNELEKKQVNDSLTNIVNNIIKECLNK